MVAELCLQIRLIQGVGFGDFEEFEDIGIAQGVAGFFHSLALAGELEDLGFVFPSGESEKEGGFLLALEFADAPFLIDCLFLVKTSFQGVFNFQ